MVPKKYFFTLICLIVHFSTKYALGALTFSMLVHNIHFKETVSHIFVWGITLYFMPKKRVTFYYFLKIYLLNFTENEPGPLSNFGDTVPYTWKVSTVGLA